MQKYPELDAYLQARVKRDEDTLKAWEEEDTEENLFNWCHRKSMQAYKEGKDQIGARYFQLGFNKGRKKMF